MQSTQKEGEAYNVLAGLFHRTRFGRIGSSGTGYKHVRAPP
jgi:hypothetical protein